MEIYRIFAMVIFFVSVLSENFYAKHNNFQILNNQSLVKEIQVIVIKRKYDCLTSCNLNQRCSLISLKRESKKCILHEIINATFDISSSCVPMTGIDIFEKYNLLSDKGRKYLLFKKELIWKEAHEKCRRINAHLLEIRNQDDIEFGKFFATQRLNGTFWIGAHSTSSVFIWLSDNSMINPLYWSKDPTTQPGLEFSEMCVLFGFGNDKLMDDQNCADVKQPFICLLN